MSLPPASLPRAPEAGRRLGAGDPDRLLTLIVAGTTWLVDPAAVLEVVDPLPRRRIPGAPEVVLGLVALRGRILPLLSAAMVLHGAPDPRTGALVVLAGAFEAALGVDGVGTMHPRQSLRRPASASVHPHRLACGVAILPDGTLAPILDHGALIDDLQRRCEAPAVA